MNHNSLMTRSHAPAFSTLALTPSVARLHRHSVDAHASPPPIDVDRRRRWNSPLFQFTTSSSEFDKDYSQYADDDGEDAGARSQFGTKSYWDAMYDGMGDFAADEYSWYYGFEVLKPMLEDYVPGADSKEGRAELNVLVPACGNDPLLLDLLGAGYRRMTAYDYSEGGVDRQRELLEYLPMGSDLDCVELRVEDARNLPEEWEGSFDLVIEKGALDAIYLSGDGNFEQSAEELARVVKAGGICISASGVVPAELRREGFGEDEWEWLRDGADDLKAGCFVLRRKR